MKLSKLLPAGFSENMSGNIQTLKYFLYPSKKKPLHVRVLFFAMLLGICLLIMLLVRTYLPIVGLTVSCANYKVPVEKAVQADDFETLDKLLTTLQTQSDCSVAYLDDLKQRMTQVVAVQAESLTQSWQLEAAKTLLERAPTIIWKTQVVHGNIAAFRGQWQEATLFYQTALDLIADPKATPQVPKPEVINQIHQLASEAQILIEDLDDTEKVTGMMRGDQVGGFGLVKRLVPIRFGFGRTSLSQKGKESIQKLAEYTKRHPVAQVVLVGHTDSKGSPVVNKIISRMRALAVKKHLRKSGVTAKIIIIGKGKKVPLNWDNPWRKYTPEQLDALNRRVDIYTCSTEHICFDTSASLSVGQTEKPQKIIAPEEPELPDMEIDMEHHLLSNNSRITIHSKGLARLAGSFPRPKEELSEWLSGYYNEFTYLSQNISRSTRTQSKQAKQKQAKQRQIKQNIALMRGFGRLLYDKFAPQEFKRAFWALKDKLGDEFDSIQIVIDDPVIPWELMIPSRDKEELDFLGIDFRVARWHISDNPALLEQPPQFLNLQEVVAIVPEYPKKKTIASHELEVLQKMAGFRRVSGRYTVLSQLFKTAAIDNSIIHFSCQGIVQNQQGLAKYAIPLEDGQLDLMTWRGLSPHPHQMHPFFFFNACDIGQAYHIANFIEGWAPAVLEAGASGYIGGLWPLADKGASEFAKRFYQTLETSLAAGQPTNVADVLRQTRQRFYENGDPTFLGYVYYGDPHFQWVRK
ncbi:MAG: hypothetical protein DRR19_26075 [Candidatus Parabeggiatoa sp. nov. 1]|nr:MAG: hypothetical protein DRR19_26075 [Gammaproteobacteria bacterium]